MKITIKKTAPVIFILLIASCSMVYASEAGHEFHEETNLSWLSAITGIFKGKPSNPPGRKKYQGLPKISLPKPDFKGNALEDILKKRRSVRNYSKEPVDMASLSQLLFSAQGITGETYGTKLRTAPSAGALYPIELYVFVHDIQGLKQGLYHYSPFDHSLTLIKEGNLRKAIMNAGLKQEMLKDANLVFALSAIPARTTWKYGQRGYRYIYMEAGHIAENILLQAVSLGLGAVPVGAFADKELDVLLGIDGKSEISLFLIAVGTVQ
jgi:SagB-type dehydrogenase family enzyme